MTKNILVTGALGFLGRHAARAAAKAGYRVTGIGRGKWSESFAREWGFAQGRAWPINSETLAALDVEPDWILHCAGSGSVAASAQNPLVSLEDNITTAASVLEYARLRAGKVKVVLVSSAAVYGDAGGGPIAETQANHPVSVYGNHKALAEDLARWYAREHQLSVGIVRLFSVYGPGLRKQLLWDACEKAVRGNSDFAGTGEELRDFIHVDDATQLLRQVALVATPGCPIWNGGTGEAVTTSQIVTAIGQHFGTPAPRFSRVVSKENPHSLIASIDRARLLGFSPQITWRAGIEEYVAWYRAQLPNRQAA